ncbi:hypothetical protein [Microvirga tunisiensis]|uniref:Uncharacterized protein n=1 Tax=Microvirga tunisiensis TaxID=2108360 RepID=A0A5N7MNU0_9HYPH|nr:hypothetical protein [Microvirga tunisiensis]MPR10113.1 hypothetical protein [Microvirga tunisiensis]MPR28320.1 hypothetical protein [Microvirga tunisiensis]
MEQAHQAADLTACSLIGPFLTSASTGEEATHQAIKHRDGSVGQFGLELDDLDHERCLTPTHAVFVEQEGWSNSSLAHELLKATFVDPAHDLGTDVKRSNVGQSLEKRCHVGGIGSFGDVA